MKHLIFAGLLFAIPALAQTSPICVNGTPVCAVATPTPTSTPVLTFTPTSTATATAIPTATNTPGPIGTPLLVGSLAPVGSSSDLGIAVAGAEAYVANNPFGLVDVLISDPVNPTNSGFANPPFAGRSVAAANGIALVSGNVDGSHVAFFVLSVNPVESPAVLGTLNTTVLLNTSGARLNGVAINSTGTLGVAAMGSVGIWTLSLSNPSTPTHLGTYDTPGSASSVALNSAATIAYVADGSGHLQIINISNLSSPTLLGSLSVGTFIQDIAVVGNTAYLTDTNYALHLVDVSNPALPFVISRVSTTGSAKYVASNGQWAGVVSGTATNDLLEEVNVTNPSTPVLTGSVVLSSTPGQGKGIAATGSLAHVVVNTVGYKIYRMQ